MVQTAGLSPGQAQFTAPYLVVIFEKSPNPQKPWKTYFSKCGCKIFRAPLTWSYPKGHMVSSTYKWGKSGNLLTLFFPGPPPPVWRKNAHMTRLSGKLFFFKKSAPEERNRPPYGQNEVKIRKITLKIRSKWPQIQKMRRNHDVAKNHDFQTTHAIFPRSPHLFGVKTHIWQDWAANFFFRKNQPPRSDFVHRMVKMR